MASTDNDRDPQLHRLERTKNDFLVAQQRRRDKAPIADVGCGDTGDAPDLARSAADRPPGIAALATLTCCI
jgi:hypothetical protein